jgi:hypothetical protein
MKQPDSSKKSSERKSIVGQRWHGSDLKKIDAWAKDKGVTRSEAIRRLVELGLLKMKTKKR